MKNVMLTAKISEEEKSMLDEMSLKTGLSVSACIRTLIQSGYAEIVKNKKHYHLEEEDLSLLPTREVKLKTLLTDAEVDKLNQLCLKTEMSKEDLFKWFIINGYIIELPFMERENQIYEIIDTFNQYSEKQGDCSELFSYIKKLIKQDWSTQHKIDTAVKKFLLEKEAELNAGYKNDDNP